MTWDENFWKTRYETIKQENDLLEQENDQLFMEIREIKVALSLGNIVDAIAQVHGMSTTGHTQKQKVKTVQRGGYQWKQ